MRIALVGDLHGNFPATKALDRDIKRRGITEIYCLGDMVGKGPSSAETTDWAFDNCKVIIGGNWDLGIARKSFKADGYYWRQLGDKRMAALESLPLEHHFWFSGRYVRLIHGRPVTPELVTVTDSKADLEDLFRTEEGAFDVVGYADAHRAFYRTMGTGILFNIGSVGNALGVPMVCYAILEGMEGKEPHPLDVTLITLPYDNELSVRDAMADPDLPHKESYIRELRTGVYSR